MVNTVEIIISGSHRDYFCKIWYQRPSINCGVSTALLSLNKKVIRGLVFYYITKNISSHPVLASKLIRLSSRLSIHLSPLKQSNYIKLSAHRWVRWKPGTHCLWTTFLVISCTSFIKGMFLQLWYNGSVKDCPFHISAAVCSVTDVVSVPLRTDTSSAQIIHDLPP